MAAGGLQDLKELLQGISEHILCHIDSGEIIVEDVKEQVKELRDIYNDDLKHKMGDENYRRPEFNNLVTRLAYTFSYYVRHVHVLRNSLSKSIDKVNDPTMRRDILDSLKSITLLCAIGGGPNTDAVGLRLFLKDNNLAFPNEVRVLDKFDEWEMTWSTLQGKIPEECRHEAKYTQFDLLADAAIAIDPLSAIRKADLITMIKSLSEVDSDTVEATERVRQILEEMKAGALLLFIDNKYCKWKRVFEDAGYMETHKILLIDEDVKVKDLSMREVDSRALRDLCRKIDYHPLLKANNSKNVMMLIKKRG